MPERELADATALVTGASQGLPGYRHRLGQGGPAGCRGRPRPGPARRTARPARRLVHPAPADSGQEHLRRTKAGGGLIRRGLPTPTRFRYPEIGFTAGGPARQTPGKETSQWDA